MIILNGHTVKSLSDLSPKFNSSLSWIKGGSEWLDWAIHKAQNVMANAPTEDSLLQHIQLGLHADALLRFPYFQLGIKKALSLKPEDMQVVQSYKAVKGDLDPKVEVIQLEYHLVSNSQLAEIPTFLSKFQLSESPVFQIPDLRESIRLYVFLSHLNTLKKVNQPALDFAEKHAATTGEFISYYNFYSTAQEKYTRKNMSLDQKANIVQGLYTAYETVCNNLIFSPNVGVGNTDKELQSGLVEFVKTLLFIGFKTKADAMYNLVSNVALNEDQTLNKDAIENYMASVVKKIPDAPSIPACIMAQDGKLRSFHISTSSTAGKSLIILNIDTEGNMYLSPDSTIK